MLFFFLQSSIHGPQRLGLPLDEDDGGAALPGPRPQLCSHDRGRKERRSFSVLPRRRCRPCRFFRRRLFFFASSSSLALPALLLLLLPLQLQHLKQKPRGGGRVGRRGGHPPKGQDLFRRDGDLDLDSLPRPQRRAEPQRLRQVDGPRNRRADQPREQRGRKESRDEDLRGRRRVGGGRRS